MARGDTIGAIIDLGNGEILSGSRKVKTYEVFFYTFDGTSHTLCIGIDDPYNWNAIYQAIENAQDGYGDQYDTIEIVEVKHCENALNPPDFWLGIVD